MLFEANLEREGTQLVKKSGHLAQQGNRVHNDHVLRLPRVPQLAKLGLEEFEGKLLNLLLKGLVFDIHCLISDSPPGPD